MSEPTISIPGGELVEKVLCPLCGDMHDVKFYYNGTPMLICEKAPANSVVGFAVHPPTEGKVGGIYRPLGPTHPNGWIINELGEKVAAPPIVAKPDDGCSGPICHCGLKPSQPSNPIRELSLLDDAPKHATERDDAAEK